MEDRSLVSFWGIEEKKFFFIIISFALFVRLYNSFHILISDEIFNLLSVERIVRGEGFNDYFFTHPPLYLLASSVAIFLSGGEYPQLPSYVSIIFSVLSIVPVYYIAENLYGRTVALWSCVFLAVLPSHIYYSSWIKQDGLLLFFFTSSLLFFLKKRYLLAGTGLGLSLLTKEFAFLFFPLSFFMILFNKDSDFRHWRSWLLMCVISAAVSFWWYAFFGTTFYNLTGAALIGGNIREAIWHLPWWYYIRNLPVDLSYPVLSMVLIGIIIMIMDIYRCGSIKSHMVLFLCILVFYIPLSFITVKTPWYTYLAMPALAMTAAIGFVRGVELIKVRMMRQAACLAVLLSIIFVLYTYSSHKLYERFAEGVNVQLMTEIQGGTWNEINQKKKFWRDKIKNVKGKVGFIEFHLMLYYLMGLKDEQVSLIRLGNFMLADRDDLLDIVKKDDIEIIVINKESLTYTEKNLADMTSLWGEPEKIGSLLLFNVN